MAQFEALAEKIVTEVLNTIGEETLPWEPEETIRNFKNNVTAIKTEETIKWLQELEADVAEIKNLTVADINKLLKRANLPPAFFADEYNIKLDKICLTIESELSKRELDWLIEKYRELSPAMQRLFLAQIVGNLD